jgi:predicted esterase
MAVGSFRHLEVDSRLGELLHHPAFAGFASRLLPWDGRDYDEQSSLDRIGEMLPYHSCIRPDEVVAGLNHMMDEVAQGREVCLEVYDNAQKIGQPAKRHVGLFFFRGRPGAPFAVIAPGGGFSYVGSVHEGFPQALALCRQEVNAFVLKYRAGLGGEVATRDLAAALSFVVEHSRALGVSTDGYALWGSSAGARMAASIGSHGAARFGGQRIPGPSAVIMAYTGHSDCSSTEPPTFAVVGERDAISPPASMARRIAALHRMGVRAELHRFADVGHGFGLGTGTSAEGWVDQALTFWREVSHGRV